MRSWRESLVWSAIWQVHVLFRVCRNDSEEPRWTGFTVYCSRDVIGRGEWIVVRYGQDLIAHRSESELRASCGAEWKYRRPRRRSNFVAEHDKIIKCYACGSMGHYSCNCRNGNNAWIQKRGGSSQARGSVPGARLAASQGLWEHRLQFTGWFRRRDQYFGS